MIESAVLSSIVPERFTGKYSWLGQIITFNKDTMKTRVTLERPEIEKALAAYVVEKQPEHKGKVFKALRTVQSFTFEITELANKAVDKADKKP